jgi:protein-L-isoaspartate(D-aspartate) O-methyltransferase
MMNLEEARRRLVESLVAEGIIRSERVKNAALKVKREDFVPESERRYAYEDMPLSIGYGQTISAPHMVFLMDELLDLKEGMLVYEIGTGSGYHAATIAEIMGEGRVITTEIVKELAIFAWRNLSRAGYSDRVAVIACDGVKLRLREKPDRILVTAAAPDVPYPLLDLLKDGGKMVIPVGVFPQKLLVVEKRGGEIARRYVTDVAFVPLRGEWGFDKKRR